MAGSSVFHHGSSSESRTTTLRPPSSVGLLADQLKLSSLDESPASSPITPRLIAVDQTSLYLRRLSSRRNQLESLEGQNLPATNVDASVSGTLGSFAQQLKPTTPSDSVYQVSPCAYSTDEFNFYPSSAPISCCLSGASSLPAFAFTPASARLSGITTNSAFITTAVSAAPNAPASCMCSAHCNFLSKNETGIPCKRACRSLSASSSIHRLSRYSSQYTLRDAATLELYRNALPRPVAVRLNPTGRSKTAQPSVLLRPKRCGDRASRLSWHHPSRVANIPHAGRPACDFSRSVDLMPTMNAQAVSSTLTTTVDKTHATRTPCAPSSSDSGNSHSSGLDLSNRSFSAFTPTRLRCESAQDNTEPFLDYPFSSPITESSTSCAPLAVPTPSSGFHDTPFNFSESSSLPDHIRPCEDPFALSVERPSNTMETCHDQTAYFTAGFKRRRGRSGGEILSAESSHLDSSSQCLACLRSRETGTLRTSSPGSVFDRQETVVPRNTRVETETHSTNATRELQSLELSSSDLFLFGFSASANGDNPSLETALPESHHSSLVPPHNANDYTCSVHRHCEVEQIRASANSPVNMNFELQSPTTFHRSRRPCPMLGGLSESVEEKDNETPITEELNTMLDVNWKRLSAHSAVLSPSIFDVTFEPIRDPNEEASFGSVDVFFTSATKPITSPRSVEPPPQSGCEILIPISPSDSDENLDDDDDHILSPQLVNRRKYFDGCVRQLPSQPTLSHDQGIDLSLIENN